MRNEETSNDNHEDPVNSGNENNSKYSPLFPWKRKKLQQGHGKTKKTCHYCLTIHNAAGMLQADYKIS